MKILITGAGGQVGRSLIATAPASAKFVAASHNDLDIADGRAVSEYVRTQSPDIIINAAAHTAVDRAESEPELARGINSDRSEERRVGKEC